MDADVTTLADELTPQQIVAELDRYVVGQQEAKKAVAIALRNRWRRKQLPDELRNEVVPHNILMIGPTGVGKTEIARRLAKLIKAPFLKVEATKFTEVGYVGRDVESIVRDLVENGVNLVKEKMHAELRPKAIEQAEERILIALVGEGASAESRQKFYDKFKNGKLDNSDIEITIAENKGSSAMDAPMLDFPGGQMGVFNIGDLLSKSMGPQKRNVRMKVRAAYEQVLKEELDGLLDKEMVVREAIKAVENDGIVFLDEIDKIAARSQIKGDVSREGVQRDLLPLVEGTIVNTKYGPVDSTHILFIASGAFHIAKPSDMLPELQGRFPIRVELKPLTEEDMVSILRDPKHSLTKQYSALFGVEKVGLEFTEDGVRKIAKVASELNLEVENIGARRLHTVMEKLLEDLNYNASNLADQRVVINQAYVEERLADFNYGHDLSKFVL
ncbi:MAG: ATP-dependent protease ATPase subunit HslU [Proteobacteria bacterium]|nr:ATP-dependent protease ATPase subunit HslU [Pseudomonadota bacterium]